jgi:hypothetical protein
MVLYFFIATAPSFAGTSSSIASSACDSAKTDKGWALNEAEDTTLLFASLYSVCIFLLFVEQQ